MEGYKINSKDLETGDVFNILLSSMGIVTEKNTETSQQLKNSILKLENSLSEEHRNEIIKAKERFFIDSQPWWGRKIENKNVDIIKKSLFKFKKVKNILQKIYWRNIGKNYKTLRCGSKKFAVVYDSFL